MKYLKKFNEAELFDDNKYGEFNKSALYYKLNGLGKFIHKDDSKGGLGLKWVINRILYPYKTKINISDIDQNAIDLLIKGGIPKEVVYKKLKNGLKGGTLFNKDGEWSFVNKLNTNYSAISMLLTDVIENGLAYNKEATYPIYVEIMKDPKEGLMKIKKYIEPLIRRYIFEQKPDGSKIDDPDLKK